jgi:hypothetical protein
MRPASESNSRAALIVIPGDVNYFYNQSGRRIAEALEDLGFGVDVTTLRECPQRDYECCVLSNIAEILHASGNVELGLARIRAIVDRCQTVASLSIDCVSTPWYHRIRDYTAAAGVSVILDLGLHDQTHWIEPADRINYRFVFSGLTGSEARLLEAFREEEIERPIPWAFVGHFTPHRTALVDHLAQAVDSQGFVYMPHPAPCTEKGSPHLNQEQFERVLSRTKYQVWCSHHSYFYMEPERFRASLLSGGVPVKIVSSRRDVPESAPLSYLMMELADVGERLTSRVFPQIRRRFRDDWRLFPTLRQEISRSWREIAIEADCHSSLAA